MAIETDYLVIGAGAMGLAFADELLTRTDAHITIVDKRSAAGGHWNDAYPFVRLHQPSVFYGVERIPQLPFSAALSGFLEATFESDAEKSSFAAPIRIADTVDEYISQLVPDTQNREACNRHPIVRAWINNSRLEGFARLVHNIDPADPERVAVIKRLRESSRAAAKNLERLLASTSRS
ncbi:MAG TPA: NAD(P)-binding protein [Polyangiales bacterium]|nr:NAD(P)-binding protein [Polyangiales bacterium]